MQGKKCNKIDCTFLHPQSYVVQQKQGQHSTQESKGDKKSAEKVDNAQVAKTRKNNNSHPHLLPMQKIIREENILQGQKVTKENLQL